MIRPAIRGLDNHVGHSDMKHLAQLQVNNVVGVPDIDFIKNRVPVAAVAGELGLEVIGNMARCWRLDNHQHGDRTPSLALDRKRNRARCFVCDPRSYSVIDLVMKVNQCDTGTAIRWIAARFPVPSRPKGWHLPSADPFRQMSRVGLGGTALEPIVRSGLWAELTPSERAVLPVFCTFSDGSAGGLSMSYAAIRRYSGIRSDSTVAAVIGHFIQLHMLDVYPSRNSDGLRNCNRYELTLDDPDLHAIMAEISASERREIEAEKELRLKARRARAAALRRKKPKSVIPEPTSCSSALK